MNVTPSPKSKSSTQMLVLAAIATVVIWQLPFGHTILYPFTLLATYAHEMGHGLTALIMGADFEQLVMNPDGSGYARWRGQVGRLGRASIAAGGLIGPSLAGATLLVISKKEARAPVILRILAVLMGLTALIWARSIFGVGFILATAVLFFGVSKFEALSAFFVQLVGVQLCLAVFSDLDYMFSESAGCQGPSDVAHIEEALFLPYWIWGGLVALLSFTILGFGLWQVLKSPKGAST